MCSVIRTLLMLEWNDLGLELQKPSNALSVIWVLHPKEICKGITTRCILVRFSDARTVTSHSSIARTMWRDTWRDIANQIRADHADRSESSSKGDESVGFGSRCGMTRCLFWKEDISWASEAWNIAMKGAPEKSLMFMRAKELGAMLYTRIWNWEVWSYVRFLYSN